MGKETDSSLSHRDAMPTLESVLGITPPAGELDEVTLLLFYDELRAIAKQHLDRERRHHTLRATALVHEAWLRLASPRTHLSAHMPQLVFVASRVMRQILVDYARARNRQKRGGGQPAVSIDNVAPPESDPYSGFEELDEALEHLAAKDARQAQVVELRFFAGLSVSETSRVLGFPRRRSSATGPWRAPGCSASCALRPPDTRRAFRERSLRAPHFRPWPPVAGPHGNISAPETTGPARARRRPSA